jgi:hypothetical protein
MLYPRRPCRVRIFIRCKIIESRENPNEDIQMGLHGFVAGEDRLLLYLADEALELLHYSHNKRGYAPWPQMRHASGRGESLFNHQEI